MVPASSLESPAGGVRRDGCSFGASKRAVAPVVAGVLRAQRELQPTWLPRQTYFGAREATIFSERERFTPSFLWREADDVNTLLTKVAITQAGGDLPRSAALLASIHRVGNDFGTLVTQAYQGILERRPKQIIDRLKEALATPDPALDSYKGELWLWLAWAQGVAGDHAAAQESWRQARSMLETLLNKHSENPIVICELALSNAGLGDKAAALALSERATTAIPIEKDAVFGPFPIEIVARVAAQTNDPDRAISALQKIFSVPYASAFRQGVPLTPALLRLDPMFDPLRNDPRFEKLASSAPKSASE